MKKILIILLCIVHCAFCIAQGWTLDSCISYAQQQSYSVIRANMAVKNAEIAERSARVVMTPSVNAGIGENLSFGLVEGANNVRENRTQSTTSFNASVSMPLFTGLRITNQIKRTAVELQAALAEVESAKESVELNVITYYLQAMYSREMQSVQQQQLTLSEQLLERTQVLVAEGRKSESELYEVEAQVAQNRQALTEAENSYRLAVVDLCQLINYKDVEGFVSEMSDLSDLSDSSDQSDQSDQSDLSDSKLSTLLPTPDVVFAQAVANRPSLEAQRSRVVSAELAIKETKADYYPQLNLNASWGTGYYHMFNGNNPAFGNQFVNNGSEVIGLSLNIPIYNRMQVRHAVKRQQIALEEAKLSELELTDRLYKEIQSAYYNALAAKDKYQAAQKSREAGAKALEFAESKYELGRMSAYEYSEAQTRLYRAEAEETQAKYEYLLRTRILGFYMR
ncbi:MAG: TolC family protein [Paludibacteraceae bacterium]|nr:TolC family protein [Paludibacteraceae bacterium]